MTSTYSHYGDVVSEDLEGRINGVLVSMAGGKSPGFCLI